MGVADYLIIELKSAKLLKALFTFHMFDFFWPLIMYIIIYFAELQVYEYPW